MRKYLSLIILILCFLVTDVNAADYFIPFEGVSEFANSGVSNCSPTNSFHNPVSFLSGSSGSSTGTSNVVYDINHISMTGNTLNLYGWAFNKVVDNALGSSTIVYVVLSDKPPTSGNIPDEFEFTINYVTASNSDSNLKYYNLTYWNCYRTSASSSSAGTCIDGDTNTLLGGFKASIDLEKAKDKAKELGVSSLKVWMYVDSAQPYTNGRDREQTWFELAASNDSNTVDSSVNSYNQSDNGISISGLSNKARMVVSSGRLMGSNGLMCSSPVASAGLNYNKVYYKYNEEYTVLEKTTAYRGPNLPQFYQSLFKLKTAKATRNGQYVTSGNDWTAYAPASWLEFTGQMTISFNHEEDPPTLACPEGYEGPYINNYMFLDSVNSGSLQTYNMTRVTSGANTTIADTDIFKELIDQHSLSSEKNYTLNEVKIVDQRSKKINSANAANFYSIFMQVIVSPKKYILHTDGEYYFYHTRWCDASGCYNTADTPSYGSNLDAYNRSMYTVTDPKITATRNSSNTGFEFNINRQYYSKSTYKNHMMSPSPITEGTLYNPAQYQITYCISKSEVVCEDDTTAAVCHEDDLGTEVVFHENDDLKTCAIPQNNNSGFTIINSSDTKAAYNNKSYCEVACKDDINIFLPTSKEAEAGQYFVFNNFTPKITAKRTCVTTEIDYSQFDDDLQAAEEDMIYAYNIWQDWGYIRSNTSISRSSENLGCCSCATEANPDCCSGTCWDRYWEINSVDLDDTPNGLVDYGGDSGSWSTGCCSWGYDKSGEVYEEDIVEPLEEAKQDYLNARAKYEDLISKYRLCTTWSDAGAYSGEYEFTFEPEVTFDYDDDDSVTFTNNLASSYEYDYDDDVETEGFKTTLNYWEEGKSTNYNYTDNSSSNPEKDTIERKLVSCTGTTCDSADKTVSNTFVTSAYIKREEEVSYTYHLPKLYTKIPSGKLDINSHFNESEHYVVGLKLEDEAVPVNINTEEGNYNYYVTVKNLSDDLRDDKETDSKKLEERFYESSGINESNGYVCNYDVINDIYVPSGEQLNYFYRTVDLENINPNSRALGYNWSTYKADKIIERMYETSQDYQELTSDEDTDRFSFTLTPAIMRQIRVNYNPSQQNYYSDWNLRCDDYDNGGYHCYSNFLTCLASSGHSSEYQSGYSFPTCYDIFANTLNGYSEVSDYDDDDLRDNREILINKQNTLDGR